MTTRDGKNPLLSVKEHGARNTELHRLRHSIQAEHKLVLGHAEAELRVRLLQEKLVAAEDRSVRPPASRTAPSSSRWRRWFGLAHHPEAQPRAATASGLPSAREVELIKEQLARIACTGRIGPRIPAELDRGFRSNWTADSG